MTAAQEGATRAFEWVHAIYRESEALLRELIQQLRAHQFVCWDSVDSKSTKYTIYLLCKFFSTKEQMTAATGHDLFIGVSFYPDTTTPRGSGPQLLFGTVRRIAAGTSKAPDIANVAARAPGEQEFFRVTSRTDDAFVVCERTDRGRAAYPWAEQVQSFALPLTVIRSPETVADVVRVLISLRDGNQEPGLELVARLSA